MSTFHNEDCIALYHNNGSITASAYHEVMAIGQAELHI